MYHAIPCVNVIFVIITPHPGCRVVLTAPCLLYQVHKYAILFGEILHSTTGILDINNEPTVINDSSDSSAILKTLVEGKTERICPKSFDMITTCMNEIHI